MGFRALVVVTAFLTGCTGDLGAVGVARGVGALPPEGPGANVPDMLELTFVMSVLRMGAEDPTGDVAPGFNLDGAVTASGDAADAIGCGQPDYQGSDVWVGDDVGVDNQTARVLTDVSAIPEVAFTPDQDFRNAITSGDVLVVIRLRTGSLIDDAEVFVDIFGAKVRPGAMLGIAETVLAEGEPASRGIAPGQQLEADPATLIDGDLRQPRVTYTGAIVDGRLLTDETDLSMRLPGTRDRTFAFELGDSRLGFEVSEGSLSHGVFGGYATTDAVIQTLRTAGVVPDGYPGMAVESTIHGYSDHDSDPSLPGCEGVSYVALFHAVPVVIDTVAAAAVPADPAP